MGGSRMSQQIGECFVSPELQTAIISVLSTATTILGGLAARNKWRQHRYTNGHDRRSGKRAEDVEATFLAWTVSHEKLDIAHHDAVTAAIQTLTSGQERIEAHLVRLDQKIDMHHGMNR